MIEEDPTGLLNEGFRYRDLETGSFITRDPIGYQLMQPTDKWYLDGKEATFQEYDGAVYPGTFIDTNPSKTAKTTHEEKLGHVESSMDGNEDPGQRSHCHVAVPGAPNIYIYCAENPWTHFDALGLLSDTQDEEGVKAANAALASSQKTPGVPAEYPKELQTKTEYGGLIYRRADGKYDSTQPFPGKVFQGVDANGNRFFQGKCNPWSQNVPAGTTEVANYHSHTSGNNSASPADKQVANAHPGKTTYIASESGVNKVTPTGTVAKPTVVEQPISKPVVKKVDPQQTTN